MTSTPDPAAALTAELARLGHRLDRVEARLHLIGAPEVPADAITSVLERPAGPTAPLPDAAGHPGPGVAPPVPPQAGWDRAEQPGPSPAGWGPTAQAGPGPDGWGPPAQPTPGPAGWRPPAQAGPGPDGWGPPVPAGWRPPATGATASGTGAAPWGPPAPAGAAWAPGTGAAAWGPQVPYATGIPAGWGPPLFGPRPAGPRATAGGARLLAWTGGAMTLLGVVLFLALAASRGWGSPAARVWSGAVLGVVLVAFAMWMHRVETRRGGAMALAGTGFGALYLVVAAANRLLQVPGPLAVLLALVVAAAGLALAGRWRSVLLASGIVVGGTLLAPVLADGPLLVALLLALQVAVAPVALRHGSLSSG
ncbi:MAG: DUF2339 domain-containing protein, partial [Pseudonocardia sp.]|nr:DUF2339 domain-containing protein [Pseudonocardia sp.]